MTADIAAIRKGIDDALRAAAPTLNAYAYPEPQPEYPCWRVGFIDSIDPHQGFCSADLLRVDLEVMVADADLENATRQLESIISSGIVDALEAAQTSAWSTCRAEQIRNFRQLDDVNGLACDVALVVNV